MNFDWLIGINSSWFWTMSQTLVVSVTLVMIYRQVKIQREQNMLNVMKVFDDQWGSEKLCLARYSVCEDYRNSAKEISDNTLYMLHFFENMGFLYKKNIIDTEYLWNIYSYRIGYYWPMLEVIVREYRAKERDGTYYTCFEDLVRSMDKYSLKKGAPVNQKMHDDLMKFAEREMKVAETEVKQLKKNSGLEK